MKAFGVDIAVVLEALVFLVVLSGCATSPPPVAAELTQPTPSAQALSQSSGSVAVTVDTYLDIARVKAYFGLSKRFAAGVLPIWISVQNNSSTPVFINPDKDIYLDSDHPFRRVSGAGQAYAMGNQIQYNAVGRTSVLQGNLLSPILAGISLRAAKSRARQAQDSAVVMERTELLPSLAEPGKSVSGFIYFQKKLPGEERTAHDFERMTIRIRITTVQGEEAGVYEFRIK